MLDILKENIRIRSSEGPEFDCYLVMPDTQQRVPAVVLASAIHGVDDDLRSIADDFALHGYISAAPDLFWRTVPGPLTRQDPRSVQRGQPRVEKINTGERDVADVLQALCKQPSFNGRAAVIGFCYGGPYAIIGPKRLGYDAGIACHGTRMLDFIHELDDIRAPVFMLWGDQDQAAPANVLDAFGAAAQRTKNVMLHVFPGVQHGYMMHDSTDAFDKNAHDFSMQCAYALLERLRDISTRPG